MLTQSAAGETGKHGIRIIEVAPGPIDTPMLTGYLQRETAKGSAVTEKTVEAATLLGRIGCPEEVADVILFFVPHRHLCDRRFANSRWRLRAGLERQAEP